jgi:pilus assembly protein Flp/PilA
MSGRLQFFLSDERGTTAIEYALIAAGISMAIVATVSSIGSSVSNMWTAVRDAL